MVDKINTSFNSIVNIVNVLFPILALLYAARVLGVQNVGIINLALTASVLCSIFAMLGISIYGMRELSLVKDDHKAISNLLSELLTLITLSTFLITFIYIIVINNFEAFAEYRSFYYLALINLIASAFNVEWVYHALTKFKILALRAVAIKVIALIAIFLFVKDVNDAYLYLGIMVSSTALLNILNYLPILRKYSPIISFKKIRHHALSMKNIFTSRICVAAYTSLDIIILGLLTSPYFVGFYSVCSRMIRAVSGVLSSATLVSFRTSVNLGNKNSNTKNKNTLNTELFILLNILSFPIIIFIWVYAHEIIEVILGDQFMPASTALFIMVPMIYLGVIGSFTGMNILYANKKDLVVLQSLAIGALVSISFNFYLAPILQHIGSAFAALLAELSIITFQLYKIKKLKLHFIDFDYRRMYRIALIFILYIIILLNIKLFLITEGALESMLLGAIIIFPVYFIMLIAIKEVVAANIFKTFQR